MSVSRSTAGTDRSARAILLSVSLSLALGDRARSDSTLDEYITVPPQYYFPSGAAGALGLQEDGSDSTWRIVNRIDTDAIVILDVFSKKTRATPQSVIRTCRRRLSDYDRL